MNRCERCWSYGYTGNVAGVHICIYCYNKIMSTCSVCKEIKNDSCAREQFDYQIMCDFCWGESCGNALKSEFNESRRP